MGSFKVYISPASPYVVGLINILQKDHEFPAQPHDAMNVKVVPAISWDQKMPIIQENTCHIPNFNPGVAQKHASTVQHMLHSHTEGYRKLTPCMNEYHLQLMIILTIFNLRHLLFQYLEKPHFLVTKKLFPQKIGATNCSCSKAVPKLEGNHHLDQQLELWKLWGGNFSAKFFTKVGGGTIFQSAG